MTIGYPITKAGLDAFFGSSLSAARTGLFVCSRFKTQVLDDTSVLPDATLTSVGYGSGEITSIRAAYAAVDLLWRTSINSVSSLSLPSDFWFDAKHFMGQQIS